jgi:hypothetical protein
MKKKLSLEELRVKSFVTNDGVQAGAAGAAGANEVVGLPIPTLGLICTVTIGYSIAVGCTGDCGTAINVTCAKGCDFQSIPVDECF